MWTVVGEHLAQLNHGCAAIDGESYCAMAEGHLAASPYNRRVLVPQMVRLLSFGSVTLRFRIVAMLSIVALVIATFCLARLLAGRLGAQRAAAIDAGIIAASIVVLNPWAIRQAWFLPVRTDPTAAALGVGAIALLFTHRRRPEQIGAVAAALCVLAREAWALPLALTAVVLILDSRKRAGALVLGALAVAAVIIVLQPTSGPQASPIRDAGYQLKTHLGSPTDALELIWNLVFPLGLLILFVLSTARWLWTRRDALTTAVMLSAAALIALATIGGFDVARLSAAAVPLLAVLTGAVIAGRTDLYAEGVVVVTGSILLWQPWRVFHGNWTAYHRFMIPQAESGATVHDLWIGTLLVAVPVCAWVFLLMRRHERAASVRRR